MASARDLRDWMSGLPNKLTLARVLAIPILMVIYPFDLIGLRVVAAFVFLAAALTDFLDGFIARKYHMETKAGALLDPIADKLLVVTGLVLLVASGALYSWLAVLLIGREFVISGMRLIALEHRFNIQVNQFGKLKTGFQVAGIFCLMINKPLFDLPLRVIGMLSLWIALCLSIYSAYLYWQEFSKNLKEI